MKRDQGSLTSSPSRGRRAAAAPLGPASSLFDMGLDWLCIVLVLGSVRLVEMSSQVSHTVTPDATLTAIASVGEMVT